MAINIIKKGQKIVARLTTCLITYDSEHFSVFIINVHPILNFIAETSAFGGTQPNCDPHRPTALERNGNYVSGQNIEFYLFYMNVEGSLSYLNI